MKAAKLLIVLALLSLVASGYVLSQNFASAYSWTREFMGFPLEKPAATPKIEDPKYVGFGKCVFCHAANYYIVKITTNHGRAFSTLVERKESKNEKCLTCHTVGYDKKRDNGGYDELHDARELEGVQCESCHGPGSNHTKGLKKMKRYLSEEACRCHTNPPQPTIDEWRKSKHATSLADLRNNPKAETRCLKCMSTEGFLGRKVDLENAVYSITCVACHDPHKNMNRAQLRMPPEELCVSCHTMEESKPGQPARHPQKEMMAATGGVGGTVPARGHGTEVKRGCIECHHYATPYRGESERRTTGHDFKALVEGCSPCHPNGNDLKVMTQAIVKPALDRLKSQLDSIDATKLDGAKKRLYDEAKFNYEFVANDGSLGVHNNVYAESLIKVAQDRLGQIQK
jgi:predicted CXXCH cytochrome family protein